MNANGELDEKDLRIMALEDLIRRFKKHDRERNERLRTAVQRVKELEEYIQELDMENEVTRLREQVKSLKANNSQLRLFIEHIRFNNEDIEDELTDEEIKEYKYEARINELRKRNKELTKGEQARKNDFDALLGRYNELQRRLEQQQ